MIGTCEDNTMNKWCVPMDGSSKKWTAMVGLDRGRRRKRERGREGEGERERRRKEEKTVWSIIARGMRKGCTVEKMKGVGDPFQPGSCGGEVSQGYCACTHTCTYVYTYIYMCVCVCVCVLIFIHIYMYINLHYLYTYTYTHTHIYIYIYIHAKNM
jgi:hypothetical protein